MTKIWYFIFLILIILSCKKDDSEVIKSQITYKGQTINLRSGFINILHEKSLGPDFDIILIDKELSRDVYEGVVTGTQNNIDDLDAINGVAFYLEEDQHGFNYLTTGQDCIDKSHDSDENTHLHGYASLLLNFNSGALDSSQEIGISSGNFCLSKSKSGFVVEFECKDFDGNIIKGFYSGTLFEFDTYDY